MEITVQALTRAAKRLLTRTQAHADIASEHRAMAKALGALADDHAHTDPSLAKRCSELADCHKRVARSHAALALDGEAASSTSMAKPDTDTDSETATKRLGFAPPAGFERPYNTPGGGITERTRAMLDMAGYDPSVDLISKSAWADNDDLDSMPEEGDDPLRKSSFADLKKRAS
jgi:hypothetical protein